MENKQLPQSFVSFSKSVFILGRRYYDRNAAKDELFHHIHKIKKAYGKKGQHRVVSELSKIEEKVSVLIEKEKQLVGIDAISNEEASRLKCNMEALKDELSKEKELRARIIESNKRNVGELAAMLHSIRERLNMLRQRKKEKA